MDANDIDQHPIHDTLAQFRAARAWPEFDLTPETGNSWLVQKVFQFTDLVKERLDATPNTLISLAGLSSLNSALQSALSELTSFKANPTPTALQNAVTHIDQTAMSSLYSLPGKASSEGTAELGQIANAYYQQIQSLLRKIEEEKQELDTGITDSVRTIEVLANDIKEAEKQIAQQKSDAAAVAAELRRDFTKTDQEFREKFGALTDEQKSAHLAQLEEARAAAANLIDELGKKRDEAADIVQIVGNIGVTGNYQKIAIEQGKQANTWRIVTFVVFIVAAGFGAFTLIEFGKDKIEWTAALVRMAYSFVIATIALYTGKESARHRSTADAARRRELELASLGPFIESLSEEKREAIRERLTERYFGGQDTPHKVDPIVAPEEVKKLLEKSIDGLTDIAKQAVKRGP